LREVSVAINGSIEGKYRAAHLIIEQVEIFKYGGPVSKTLTFIYFYLLNGKCRLFKAEKY
jgi:hypothetical protein